MLHAKGKPMPNVPKWDCECADPMCPAHPSLNSCAHPSTRRLFRVDMMNARIRFCDGCADDALESGVFAEECDAPSVLR
jgi:hypothetical protein